MDFSHEDENVEEGLRLVAKGVLAHGTTSFCPTLVTSLPEFYHKVMSSTILLSCIKCNNGLNPFCRLLEE